MEKECPICKKKLWKYYIQDHIKRNHFPVHTVSPIVDEIIDEIIQMVSDYELLKELGERFQLEREEMSMHLLGMEEHISMGLEHMTHNTLDKVQVVREQAVMEELRVFGVESEQRGGEQAQIQLVNKEQVGRGQVGGGHKVRDEGIEPVGKEQVRRGQVGGGQEGRGLGSNEHHVPKEFF